jgi:hypothetical protein
MATLPNPATDGFATPYAPHDSGPGGRGSITPSRGRAQAMLEGLRRSGRLIAGRRRGTGGDDEEDDTRCTKKQISRQKKGKNSIFLNLI